MIVTRAAPALADGYLSFESSLGGPFPLGPIATLGVAGATSFAPGLLVRGAILAGVPVGDVSGGRGLELRAGVERRPPDCGIGCLYAGVDLVAIDGNVRDSPDETDMTGAFAALRGGLDIGGRVRFRLGLEIELGVGRVRDIEPDLEIPKDSTSTKFIGGFALTAGIAFEL